MVKEANGYIYEDELIDILKECASKKLWRGTLEERKLKFLSMHSLFNQFYGRNIELQFDVTEESDKIAGASGESYYAPPSELIPEYPSGLIMIKGRLSVITFLHEWAHAIGCDQEGAQKWSLGLFKMCFPQSYNNLASHPAKIGLMIRRNEVPDPVLNETQF